MVPNPFPEDELCDSEIEVPVVYEEEDEEDLVVYSCKGKKNHQGLHHDWLQDDNGDQGLLIVWPVEEDIDEEIIPDELA